MNCILGGLRFVQIRRGCIGGRKKYDGCNVYSFAVRFRGGYKGLSLVVYLKSGYFLLSRIFHNYILDEVDNEICRFHF